MKKAGRYIIFIGVLLGLALSFTRLEAQLLQTKAEQAFLMDAYSGVVLLEKDSDVLMSPASMSKLMTSLLVFEALEDGRIKLGDLFLVSDNAWKKGGAPSGGSTMFAKRGSRVPVDALLRGVIVQSGNDASIVLAEGLAGSEEVFSRHMTERAHELGLTKSSFVNATGWPDPGQKMTARELAVLAKYIIKNYPQYYGMYSEKSFTWNDIKQQNRNPLLYANIGADGLKTGHTEESGYGLVASAVSGERRLILVINGLKSKQDRAQEAQRIMNWGFRNFNNYKIFDREEGVLRAPVWHGEYRTVPLIAQKQFSAVIPRRLFRKMSVSVEYKSPLIAPLKKGKVVGEARVFVPGMEPQKVPVVIGMDMERKGFFRRTFSSLIYLTLGKI
ncbi:MAG: D-alanyl-D-alanine carboxypeptidase family protein [Parvibaculales bacterium]